MVRWYQVSATRAEVTISSRALAPLRRNHPWIWARSIERVLGSPGPGDVVTIRDRRGADLGAGFYDPGSPIRVRVLVGPGTVPGAEWVEGAANRAAAIRLATPGLAVADAMRLVHGAGDGLPGLVVDRYGPVAAVRYDGEAAAVFWRPHIETLLAAVRAAGHPIASLYERGRGVVAGAPLPDELVVSEGAARFEVDLAAGHKTGLFLDQRPHRLRVGALSRDAEVLNLFGYTGGFSVHAGLGGARRVTTVDSAAPAIAAARRNLARSGLDLDRHRLVAGDAFAFLAGACPEPRRRAERFDLVVCDPPSFAPRRSARERALAAYQRLNRLALSAISAGGLLVTCSCSSHVRFEDFEGAVAAAAAEARRGARVVGRGGAGPDHPVRPGFPEGDYLKVLYIAVD